MNELEKMIRIMVEKQLKPFTPFHPHTKPVNSSTGSDLLEISDRTSCHMRFKTRARGMFRVRVRVDNPGFSRFTF